MTVTQPTARNPANLIASFKPTDEEMAAIDRALVEYLLKEISNSKGGYRGRSRVLKPTGTSADKIIEEVACPDGYEEDHTRYHQLIEILLARAREIKERRMLMGTDFPDAAADLRAEFDKTDHPARTTRNAAIKQARDTYAEAIAEARSIYDTQIRVALLDALNMP